ncbi:hypothetical protein MBLNU459_g4738t2 [Dothideomycetes sp. NU459]
MVQFFLETSKDFRQAKIDLDLCQILDQQELVGKHSYVDAEDMKRSEIACLADPRVKAEIIACELPDGTEVVVEPWTYATDGMFDVKDRVIMCWFYMRLDKNPDANYYAYPLDIFAEMNSDLEVIQVYRLPSGEHDRLSTDSSKSKKFDRRKIHQTSEYYPNLVPDHRISTKPLHVMQSEGPSFKTEGNLLTWEKWRFRVGFNYREGLVLHNICYDGRSLFYRLSLSEMFVPYGDSRSPYPRKAAFDLGNDGAGVNANNLRLGCDCLGHIKYFDAWHNTNSGNPVKLPNVVCCHEIDDGILWKHTNFRTNNAVVARSRVLVLQSIITVSNYEYIFAFYFGQDASIHYEVRATGILSTNPINIGDRVPYGTVVAPGVMAPFHQHLFSLRIDPAIDGHQNSLMVEESEAMPIDDPAIQNPFGVGYITKSNIVENEGPLDLDISKGRVFKIINEGMDNPTTGTPVGYKLVPQPSQMLLAHPTSYHAKRSEFAAHAVWVTRYSDTEVFAAGQHTMQSIGGDGVASWIKQRQEDAQASTSVRNEDIVIWHTFGTSHNPRIEDWPVMPSEKMVVGLKPVNFFARNPAIDVAISWQDKNKSVLVS